LGESVKATVRRRGEIKVRRAPILKFALFGTDPHVGSDLDGF